MSGGGGKPKIAPLPAPIPTPEDISTEAQEKGEQKRRRLRAQAGRQSTVLTESTLGGVNLRPEQNVSVLGQVG